MPAYCTQVGTHSGSCSHQWTLIRSQKKYAKHSREWRRKMLINYLWKRNMKSSVKYLLAHSTFILHKKYMQHECLYYKPVIYIQTMALCWLFCQYSFLFCGLAEMFFSNVAGCAHARIKSWWKGIFDEKEAILSKPIEVNLINDSGRIIHQKEKLKEY